jgi:DNA-directed RNA polymerase specialized sigma24 family protein
VAAPAGREKCPGSPAQGGVSRARVLAAASSGRPGTPLLAALRELPARQRESLVLRYYADWPDLEIASVTGISGRAVNAHIRRGLSALTTRAAMRRDGPS